MAEEAKQLTAGAATLLVLVINRRLSVSGVLFG